MTDSLFGLELTLVLRSTNRGSEGLIFNLAASDLLDTSPYQRYSVVVRQLIRLIVKILVGGRTTTYNCGHSSHDQPQSQRLLPSSAVVLLCAISPLLRSFISLCWLPSSAASSILASPSIPPCSLQHLVMGKPNPLLEGGHVTHPTRALQKKNGRQRRAKKLEHRKKVERKTQTGKLAFNNSMVHRLTHISNLGIPSITNTDEEDRMMQREGSRWLKEYIKSKQPDLTRKDQLGLHAFFSMNLAKHARPDPYYLGFDAQKIIELFNLRVAHAYEAEDARHDELRKERLEREEEQERADAEEKK